MPRTPFELQAKLDDDLIWRKKELTLLQAQIESPTARSKGLQRALIRCGVAVLYAHWEGYIKKAAGEFLEFVSAQRPNAGDLTSSLLTLAWRKAAFRAEEVKPKQLGGITEFFRTKMNSRMPYLDGSAVNTESNLSSKVLREILWSIGLDDAPFLSKSQLIDEKLLGKRNHIAHGQYLDVEFDDYVLLRSEILGMLEAIKTGLLNSAVNGEYLLRPPAIPAPITL